MTPRTMRTGGILSYAQVSVGSAQVVLPYNVDTMRLGKEDLCP